MRLLALALAAAALTVASTQELEAVDAFDRWARERQAQRRLEAGMTKELEPWEDLISVAGVPTDEEWDLAEKIRQDDVRRYRDFYDEDTMLGFAKGIYNMRLKLRELALKRWSAAAQHWDPTLRPETWPIERAYTLEERYFIEDVDRLKQALRSETLSPDRKRIYAAGLLAARKELLAPLADEFYEPLL